MRCILFFALAIFSTEAVADTWIPATTVTHEAADHSARITVVPRDLDSPLAYFRDKADGREPAGGKADSTATSATAVLEIKDASGRWVTSWAKPLVNEVAPVEVLVASAGRRIVTFDNWHSMGYGPHAIVIYDEQGNVIRMLGLEDLIPKWFVAAQPHSVSSIWWRGQPRISDDGSAAIIPIKLPSEQQNAGMDGPSLDLLVRLSDGEAMGLTDQPWRAALDQAAAIARQMCRAERTYITEWNSPIAAPSEWIEPVWHNYLREIVYRSAPNLTDDEGPIVETKVLRPPYAQDFQPSVKWLREALTEKTDFPDDDVRALGSPDYERLTQEIERVASKISAGRLKGVQLIIVIDELHSSRVRTALSRSGAKLRIVNPLEQIPQRPERMREADADLPVCLAPQP